VLPTVEESVLHNT